MPERHPGWVDGIDAAEARLATGLLTWPEGTGDQLDPLRTRAGLRDAPGEPGKVTVGTNKVTVNPFQAVVADPSRPGAGPYLVTLDAAKDLPLPAADQANSRLDLVVATVDPAAPPGVLVQLLAGSPAASPQPPALPGPTVLLLAQITVPAVGRGAPAVADRRQFTAALGGILPVATAATLPSAVPNSALAYRFDTRTLLMRRDGQWVPYTPPAGSIDSWNAVTFESHWANYGGGYPPAGYTLTGDGWVRLRGLVKDGAAGAIFRMPAGYRPRYRHLFAAKCNIAGTVARVDVDPTGAVVSVDETTANAAWISLDGIAFPTY